MAKLFAYSGDPDQTPHSAASDLGLHCLPLTLLRVPRLKRLTCLNRLIMAKMKTYGSQVLQQALRQYLEYKTREALWASCDPVHQILKKNTDIKQL